MKKKFSYIILCGFFVFAMASTVCGIYMNNQLSEISMEVREASEISQTALHFSEENFNTQLEIWEYAYAPTDARLLSYNEHNERLTESLDNLLIIVERESRWKDRNPGKISSLNDDGVDQISEIIDNLNIVRADWASLLESIKNVQYMIDAGYDNKYSENHYQYMIALDESREKVIANENLFEELKFNEKISYFISAQEKLLENLYTKQKLIVNKFIFLFVVLITFFVILSIGSAIFISRYV